MTASDYLPPEPVQTVSPIRRRCNPALVQQYKLRLRHAAVRAQPRLGHIGPQRSGRHAIFRIALRFVVDVSANNAFVLCHYRYHLVALQPHRSRLRDSCMYPVASSRCIAHAARCIYPATAALFSPTFSSTAKPENCSDSPFLEAADCTPKNRVDTIATPVRWRAPFVGSIIACSHRPPRRRRCVRGCWPRAR